MSETLEDTMALFSYVTERGPLGGRLIHTL